MTEQELYTLWSTRELEDSALSAELAAIQNSPEEIFDRFYTQLDFGTAGLRGVLGAGTNRMNIYTVRQATQGFSTYLKASCPQPKVAIAYDSRNNSELFAREAACVFAANGIKVHIYSELMPTPALSYALRQLGCDGGVVITASHNPAKYNGYKAYDNTGSQIGPEAATAILEAIRATDIFEGVSHLPFDEGLKAGTIQYIGDEMFESYISRVLQEQQRPGITKDSGLKIVYTPLNGAGRRCVMEVFKRIGMDDVTIVPEQAYPDGNFPTCPFPNPEIREALAKGLELCDKLNADLLIATDPDSDRVGVAVKTPDGHRLISGNEMGVLMLDYICRSRVEQGRMPKNPVTIRTIVTTNMVDAVAAKYGVEVKTILTGFKYIGEWIKRLEDAGEPERFIFGYEESYGYLTGGFVRDKDAVDGSLIICEMAAYYKRQGKSLGDAMDDLYQEFGCYNNHVDSLYFEGADGMKKMSGIMDSLRAEPLTELAGRKVTHVADYRTGVITKNGETTPTGLPSSNVLEYGIDGLGTLIVRPSGTEPKLKVYYSIKAPNRELAQSYTQELIETVKPKLGL